MEVDVDDVTDLYTSLKMCGWPSKVDKDNLQQGSRVDFLLIMCDFWSTKRNKNLTKKCDIVFQDLLLNRTFINFLQSIIKNSTFLGFNHFRFSIKCVIFQIMTKNDAFASKKAFHHVHEKKCAKLPKWLRAYSIHS